MSTESRPDSGSGEPVDPALVEETKQQIRDMVGEIAQLARQDLSLREFYGEFVTRVVQALAAKAGAVWAPGDNGLDLEYQLNLRETNLSADQSGLVRHHKLLARVTETGEPLVAQPHSGEGEGDEPGNPTPFLLVLAPVKVENTTRGIVEVFQRPGADPRTQRGYLRFVLQMCDIAADFLKNRDLRHFTDRQSLWSQLEHFTRVAHASLDPRLTAYTIANEGRRLIECDRVSVAIKRGRKCKVESVSGQDVLDKRSTTVQLLNNLATAVVRAGEPMWYSGETADMAPQVEEAVQAYVDETHSKNVAVLPLVRPGDPEDEKSRGETIGALIVEQIEDARAREGMVQRVRVVSEHSATALSNALEHNNLFLLPVWRTLGKAKWLVAARTLPKTVAVATAILAVAATLALLPWDFTLRGEATLQPAVKHFVFTPESGGTIENLHVKHGDRVHKGQLLAELKNNDLDNKIVSLEGQFNTKVRDLQSKNSTILKLDKDLGQLSGDSRRATENQLRDLYAQASMLQVECDELDRQLKLEKHRKESLKVHSPVDGVVTSWDLEKKLATRTVQPGEALMEVSDPNGPWQLELLMPEDRMGHIAAAQQDFGDDLEVSYVMATNPEVTLTGRIKEVHLSAEVRQEHGNTVLVTVAINKDDLKELNHGASALNQGASATAHVACGTRSLGYYLLHDVIDAIYKFKFRFLP